MPTRLLHGRLSRILQGMEVRLTPEQEARLAEIAAAAGTDPEHLVKNAVLRLMEPKIHSRPPVSELPILHLGAMKSLRRRDIYSDVG